MNKGEERPMTTSTHTTSARVLLHRLVGSVLSPVEKDERGLSQSTENAVLLAGAITVAGIVVAAVTAYVQGHMPK